MRIGGITSGLSRAARRQAEAEARALAVRDALAIARELADAAGLALGPVLSLSDGAGGGGGLPEPRMFRMAAPAAMAADAEGAAMPVAVGETTVTARVGAVVALS